MQGFAIDKAKGAIIDRIRLAEEREQALAKQAAETETKAAFLQSLLVDHRALIKSLVEKGEESGDLVGSKEAAKALGISAKTLREKADHGEIPYHGTGKQKRFSIAEIKEATKVESTTEKRTKIKGLIG